jgi:hypothetical protein
LKESISNTLFDSHRFTKRKIKYAKFSPQGTTFWISPQLLNTEAIEFSNFPTPLKLRGSDRIEEKARVVMWKKINVPAGGGKSGSPTHKETTASPLASILLVIACISIVLLTSTVLKRGFSRPSFPVLPLSRVAARLPDEILIPRFTSTCGLWTKLWVLNGDKKRETTAKNHRNSNFVREGVEMNRRPDRDARSITMRIKVSFRDCLSACDKDGPALAAL